ncbi:MAG: tetratricopeptide repeat protein, partial [Acidobacteria bacterium]|nr:tetratricopeptide repeat protein [Acidobacteriota bacterium]
MMHSHTVFSMLAGSITRPAGRATSGLNRVLAVTMGLALFASAPLAATAQSNGQAELLLREAMHAEISDGDLERAIELYRTIVERYGNARSVAAQALLRIGMSYEKLGMREAREAYAELLSNYGDQPDAVAEARSRLASLQSEDETDRRLGLVTRQVWPNAPVDTGNISPDGRYVAFVLWQSDREKLGRQPGFGGDLNLLGVSDLAVYDTEMGRVRPVTNYIHEGRTHEYVTSMAWSRDGA